MDKNRLIQLFDHYINASATEEETLELFAYINKPENAQQVTELLETAFRNESGNIALPSDRQKMILDKILEKERPSAGGSRVLRLRWIKMAAAVLIFLTASLLFINRHANKKPAFANRQRGFNNIHPGGNKATLTLGNGEQISLNDQKNGTISRQGGSEVIKLANGQLAYNAKSNSTTNVVYNTMSTPRGGKYDLILADGTKVWLNAASSITYPTAFNESNRTVSITGEAYFEVAHDKSKPFRVTVQGQTVEVLGTHFNINAYTDEDAVRTTLLEGKVKITKGPEAAILAPGQQSIIRAKQVAITVENADTDDAVAWKNGLTSFKNANIREIMRQVSRWYSVDVGYKGEVSDQRTFTGEIPRNAELSDVLKVLELSKVHFEFSGNKLTVSP
jgi:ferric-dicitrate binding protein FerR (iron transport regulator)